jgi:hypothetical protein
MSLQSFELEHDANHHAVRGHTSWAARETSKIHRQSAAPTLNARVVEFIAKPEKVELLEEYVRGQILESLNRQRGFAGAIVLNSHQERRLILVVSFWTTQRMAEENNWERSRVVRQAAGALIDVCSRVHTYGAVFAKSSSLKNESLGVWTSLQEVQE